MALAYERQLISNGCKIRLAVDSHHCNQMTKESVKQLGNKQDAPSHIKLQIVKKGLTSEKYVDVNLEPDTILF